MKYSILFTILALLGSCASKTSFQVNSEPPGAKVFAKNIGTESKIELGVTPLKITAEELEKKQVKSGPILVEIEKENYHAANLYITDAVAVDIETTIPLKPMDKVEFAKDFDKVANQITQVQKLIKEKSFNKALDITKKIKEDFPMLSTPEELEGNIYFLMKDFQKAYGAFSAAYTKNADNIYALQMIKIIEKNNNITKPKG